MVIKPGRYESVPEVPAARVCSAAQFLEKTDISSLMVLAHKVDTDAIVTYVEALDAVLICTKNFEHGDYDYEVVRRGQVLVYSDYHILLYTEDAEKFVRGHVREDTTDIRVDGFGRTKDML